MISESDFASICQAIGGLRVDTAAVRERARANRLSLSDLALGWQLGIIDELLVSRIMLDYFEAGAPMDSAEEQVALALGEQSAEIKDALNQYSFDDWNFDSLGGRFWLKVLEEAFLENWYSSSIVHYPYYELIDLLPIWGNVGRSHWQRIQPRGFDSVWGTKKTETRILVRLREIVNEPL